MRKYTTMEILSTDSKWAVLLEDAASQLKEAEDRVMQLKASIRFFEDKIKSGEPVPDGIELVQSFKNKE